MYLWHTAPIKILFSPNRWYHFWNDNYRYNTWSMDTITRPSPCDFLRPIISPKCVDYLSISSQFRFMQLVHALFKRYRVVFYRYNKIHKVNNQGVPASGHIFQVHVIAALPEVFWHASVMSYMYYNFL